jgi:hypothetical protein
VSYLQQLLESQPLAERYPPHAWPVDSEPWTGREDRIARIFRDTRELADMLRQWRAVDPQHPDAERCRAMFVHFNARWKALLSSWRAQGLAN